MGILENKIEAQQRSLKEVLSSKKYTVDYFQREYSWGKQHITDLVYDLTEAFMSSYTHGDARSDGSKYANYYLGSFILSNKEGKLSIIDGQQRLTSMTLLLIYLNNLQKEYNSNEDIGNMIFSESRGDKSYNIHINNSTEQCFDTLFKNNKRDVDIGTENSSVVNMYDRYEDIKDSFPPEIDSDVLPFFIDWVKENVILVEIMAYSEDNCYAIFESMNNRGLSLTQADLLKGFILSNFSSADKRQSANEIWKDVTHRIRSAHKKAEEEFFIGWIRSQYAKTYRPIRTGSQNGDFEIISKRFHSWMHDNAALIGLDREYGTFDELVHADVVFYAEAYIKILEAEKTLTTGLDHVYYTKLLKYPNDLRFSLMLSPLQINDDPSTVATKMNMVADYIETESVRRLLNGNGVNKSQNVAVYELIMRIRRKSIEDLKAILEKQFHKNDTSYSMSKIRLTNKQANKQFIKFLLSRISVWIDNKCGVGTTFNTYFDAKQKHGKPYEIEHIWADKYDQHRDEFDTKEDFRDYRSKIGNLVLLPHGTNQSYGSLPYTEKLRHYIKENTLVKALCDDAYSNNPNFTNVIADFGIPFRSHSEFKKQDILDREKVYLAICRQIWSDDLTPPE